MAEKPGATEVKVRDFYDQKGWAANDSGDTLDAQLWEDLRPMAQVYVSACRRRILKYLPSKGDRILDAASGPIQYPEYLEYSANFKKRVCVDISARALEIAKSKLGDKGETHCASLLKLPFGESEFDATVSLHTIYHIDKVDQEAAVRELLRVTKIGAPVIIVYSNPNKLLARIKRPMLHAINFLKNEKSGAPLYFFAHPISWWKRFEDEAEVVGLPWRSVTAKDAKWLVPANAVGKKMLGGLLRFENTFPQAALQLGAYPMFVLRKRH